LAADSVSLVCEPIEKKRRPGSGYDAQFSVPYAIASILARGQLTLAELEPEAFTDPEILAQCDKVTCEPDAGSAYPKYFSGEVIVTTHDGRELTHREQINRGADERPLSAEEITAKFRANAELTFASDRVEQVRSWIWTATARRRRWRSYSARPKAITPSASSAAISASE
jgi:2-methylcitrate dehydratase PrpD